MLILLFVPLLLYSEIGILLPLHRWRLLFASGGRGPYRLDIDLPGACGRGLMLAISEMKIDPLQ